MTLRIVGLVTLTLHTLAVLLGIAYLVLSLTVGATPDANIGAGLALFWLVALGSPWSWPVFSGTGGLTGTTELLVIFGAVALNLALHSLLVLWLRRRTRPS